MRLYGCLLRAQCRSLARLGTAGLLLVVFVAIVAQLAAGLPPAMVISVRGLAGTLAATLPEFLAILLPVSLAHCWLTLEETGERGALAALGVRPATVLLVALVPLAPCLVALHLLVHDARPAARADAKQAAMASEQGFWRGMESVGVGHASIGAGLHALLPLGDAVMAITATAARSEPRASVMEAGTVQVIDGGEVGRAEFAAARLSFAPVRVGLAHLHAADLSTRFLVSQSIRWRRAKLRWHGERSAEILAVELGRRRWAVPGLLLAVLITAGLLGWRRRLTLLYVYGFCSPVTVAVSLGLGRMAP